MGESAEDMEMEDAGNCRYDFSTLPEVVWVQIMQYLHLKERYYLSVTCHSLYDHFHHPSLWNTIRVVLSGGTTNFTLSNTFIPDRFVHMIDKFGHLFQKLTIKIMGHLSTFDDESRNMMTKLSEICRLESLTLEAGKLISQYDIGGIAPFKSDLMIFISFVKNAYRLKHFNLVSWPMYPTLFTEPELNIFDVLIKNQHLKDIESLSLFWRNDSSWSEREPLLPSPSFLMTILPHLRNISHLALRSPMLSDEILTMLASPDRSKLKFLQIYVTFSSFNQAFQIPDISHASWKALVTASPELEVECSVMSQVPNPELSLLLNPEVPLVSVTFLRYSRCNGMLISSIADKFRKTLREFTCFADCSEADDEIRYLAAKCCQLKKFVYHGTIKCSTVVDIVTQKDGKWSALEFVEKNLDTFDEEDPLLAEGDEIIRRNEAGEYILVDLHRFHREDDNREDTIKQLSDIVSGALGYNWKPI